MPDKIYIQMAKADDGRIPVYFAVIPVPFEVGQKFRMQPKEERDKGFVRPVRSSYKHVGPPGPEFRYL